MHERIAHFMKMAGIAMLGFFLIFPLSVYAQDDFSSAAETIKKRKKEYIATVMDLTQQEEDQFWHTYGAYESGLAAIKLKRILLT